MTRNYGVTGVNKIVNSKLSNNSFFNTNSKLNTLIQAARVISIVLDASHPRFVELGEWNALGVIEYEFVDSPIKSNLYPVAYSANSNLKNYPLINEIVYIISLPSTLTGDIKNKKIAYYINNINIWNHPHHNAYPSIANEPTPPQQKDYIETELGSSKVVVDEARQILLGNTFEERSNIHPLLPFEGDVIHEGRWGNSIRLGSTVKNIQTNQPVNVWSTGESINGDPIIIIRNGQGDNSPEGWIPTTEDITKDLSSIYLSSTQKIPLDANSTSYISYSGSYEPPISPKDYSESQIILDSGRLVFNSWNDHILLSSAKSINLNSIESVNIDTTKFITQAENIYLGIPQQAIHPLMYGDITSDVLRDLIKVLINLTKSLQTLNSDPVIPNQPATFSELLKPTTDTLITLQGMIDNILGEDQTACKLISQRNFTM